MGREKTNKEIEQRVKDLERKLTEREKELNCLYELSNLIEKYDIFSDEVLQKLPFLLQASWQYPQKTFVRILVKNKEFATGSFKPAKWRQTADILVRGKKEGKIEVWFTEEMPDAAEDPFLSEERSLLDAVAERLGRALERKRWEEELRLQWKQFAAIIDNFAHSLYISDPRTYEVLLVNKTFEKMLGRNPVGGLCYREFQGRSTPCDFCTNDIILEHKEPYVWEHYNPLLKKDFLLLDQIIRWTDGRLVRYEIAVDITEQKKTEGELRETKTFLEKILSSLADAVFVVDPETRAITTCNPAVKNIFGYNQEELIGKNTEFLHVDRQMYEEFGSRLFPALDEKGVFRTDYRMRRKDGTVFHTENTVTEIVDDSGRRTGAVSVVRDITARVSAEQERDEMQSQLLQARKMESLGTLAGGIAHDFNNILMPITLNTELMLRNTDEHDKNYRYLKDILQAAKHGKDLVKQITTFSRQSEQKRKSVKIAPVIKEALKLLKASLPSTIQVVENIEDDSSGVVMADPTQIHQVLMNLCTNAAYSMRKRGGELDVELKSTDLNQSSASSHPDLRPGPYMRISVSDTGEGVAQENIERIFEPFFTTKERSEGTGMGLPAAHGIVKSHGGAITVSSDPCRGSSFNVFLPKIKEVPAQEDSSSTEMPTGMERILLVDDEDAVLRSVENTLEGLGYEVVCTPRGDEALKLFEQQSEKFDLVVTDQTMPSMTGLELSRNLLRIRGDIPIILCTGFNEAVDKDKAREEGVREFLMKPFNTEEMARIIRRIIES